MAGNRDPEIVLDTPWFRVLAEHVPGWKEPNYSIEGLDFVIIVATNPAGELLLVRQFRPTQKAHTLELPAGHVEKGETPEEAARKELCEETGYEADTFEFLAKLAPSTARFTNRAWIFFAPNVRPAVRPAHAREEGVEAVFYKGSIRQLIDEKEFIAAVAFGALFVAAARGRIEF